MRRDHPRPKAEAPAIPQSARDEGSGTTVARNVTLLIEEKLSEPELVATFMNWLTAVGLATKIGPSDDCKL